MLSEDIEESEKEEVDNEIFNKKGVTGEEDYEDADNEEEIVNQLVLNNKDNIDTYGLFKQNKLYSKNNLIKRSNIIVITSANGGVGKSTLAASLAYHYHIIGERVGLVDLGSPRTLFRHIDGIRSIEDGVNVTKSDFCNLYDPVLKNYELNRSIINDLLNYLVIQYKRVVVDLHCELDPDIVSCISYDKLVIVFDSNLIQSVEPVKNISNPIYVYNKAIPEVDIDLVCSILNSDVIQIEYDIEGCYSALAGIVPVYCNSEVFAKGVSELASILEK